MKDDGIYLKHMLRSSVRSSGVGRARVLDVVRGAGLTSELVIQAVKRYRFRVAVTDTSPEVAAAELELYRALGPSGRVQIAVDLSDAVRETALAGIRRRHPEYAEDEVSRAFLTLVYGPPKRPIER